MLKPSQADDSANNCAPIIFSFFAGSGFLDLGFERTGFDVRFVNEFHKPFYEAYKYSRQIMNYPKPRYEHHLGSIDEFLGGKPKKRLKQYVTNARKEGLVGFIGGPPCPDFSVAGKNKGRAGDHGKLTESYIDTIVTFGPDFFFTRKCERPFEQ